MYVMTIPIQRAPMEQWTVRLQNQFIIIINERTKMDNICDDNTDVTNEKTKMDNACDDNTDTKNEKPKMDNVCDDNTDLKNEKPIWIMKVLLMLLQRIMMEQSQGILSHVEQHDEL